MTSTTEQGTAGVVAGLDDERRWDVFLSYCRRDREVVERIAGNLKRAGLEPWLDRWCATPGVSRQQEIAAALNRSDAFALFIGPGDLGSWEERELELALDRAARDLAFRVFPVLLPGVSETFDAASLPPFLSMKTWVDLRSVARPTSDVQSLVNAIRGLPSGPPTALTSSSVDVSPYPGLRTFDERDAPFFFGREAERQRLAEQLKVSRFVAVVGASGSATRWASRRRGWAS